MDPYIYNRLTDDHSIRMLTLFAGSGDQPLAGSLDVCDMNIESRMPYEPLSYVWGNNPGQTYDFECNGKCLKITATLQNALRRIRLPHEDRCIWVDQICIDQVHTIERGEQVRFMNTIYKQAKGVLVWLGSDERGEAEEAFSHVRTLAKTLTGKNYETFRSNYIGEKLSQQREEDWLPIKSLTKLEWFERVWIIQEIGTEAPATLFWGGASIDWQTLYNVCDKLTKFHHLRRRFDINTDKVKFPFQRFVWPERKSRHANRLSFIYELHRARHLEATDARDRVFAFLGHYSRAESRDSKLLDLAANYDVNTGTLSKVYTDVAIRALFSSRSNPGLVVLGAVQHESLARSTVEWESQCRREQYIPSWVPDWTKRKCKSHILSEPVSPHRASGRLEEPSLHVESGLLRIKGALVDIVSTVSQPLKSKAFHRSESSSQNISAPPQVVRLWSEIYGQGVGESGHVFTLGRPYAKSARNSGRSCAFAAYMQTLSNGGAATALRRRDRLGDVAQDIDGREFYEAIALEEWLAQGAAYLCHTFGDTAAQHMSPDLREIGMQALAAVPEGDGEGGPYEEWSRSANGATSNRVFARTQKGYCVLGPAVLAENDVVCVLWGGNMCFCLRPLGPDKYLLVGECYVHGFMNGEAVEMVEAGELQETEFILV